MFAGQQFLNCVRSEIHNVLSTMRRNGRWASEERFQREIPLHYETPLIRAFKSLHDYLLAFDDINDVDAVAYLKPFLDVVSFRNTNGAMTGRALSSINKFLLYGSISQESPHAREAINLAVASVVDCKFESTNAYNDEVVLMQLLEVIVNLLRCPAGPFITDINVWKMVETCFRLKSEPGTSVLLRSTAANSLTHIILTIFSRSADLITAEAIRELCTQEKLDFDGPSERALEKIVDLYDGGILEVDRASEDGVAQDDSDINFDRVDSPDDTENLYLTLGRSSSKISAIRLTQAANLPSSYGLPVLVKVLEFLSDLTNPATNDDDIRIFALQLINIVLETAGETLGTTSPGSTNQTPLVTVLQGDLCKFLLQNSQSDDLAVLSLTLRVVFNLFNAMKGHLKVQLEVFLISVHLRIAESPTASFEWKELALESLLDFCREPALMLDLYTNYDCDFKCTNLFETLCKCLCRCAVPSVSKGSKLELMSLHRLSLEGILAVIEDIARRCTKHRAGGVRMKSPKSEVSKDEKENTDLTSELSAYSGEFGELRNKALSDDQLGWLESARERTAIVLRSRKQKKRRLLMAAKQFNKNPHKSYWLDYAKDLGVLPAEVSAADVADFFLNTPGLDKAKVGDYLGDGPKEDKPFNTQVLEEYMKQFDFKNLRIDVALRLILESFRLPGEAQKVDRVMEAFGTHLYEQNKSENFEKNAIDAPDEDAVGVFASPDAAFIFAFSIIMLHTDLHNAQIREDKKMKKSDFIKNNRSINDGKDLPPSLLEKVYDSISDTEIRMLYDPHSHSESLEFDSGLNGAAPQGNAGPTWDGVLRHSETVDEASFTPSAIGRSCIFRAGVHERDMFTIVFDAAMSALSSNFELTADGNMVTRALEGYRNLAKIAAYFDMDDAFNHIVITLCKYFGTFSNALQVGTLAETDIDALQSLKEAIELSYKRNVSSEKMATTILRAEIYASNPCCKALLTFQAFLSLAVLYGNHMRESWRNVIRAVLLLHEAKLLPHAFVELDDITDAEGHVLPSTARIRSSRDPEDVAHVSNSPRNEGMWNALTSFLWADPATLDKENAHAKFLIRETVAAFRLNNIFFWSKHLHLDSVLRLINALSMPPDDSERNVVLSVELLTEVALSNQQRIEQVWPSISKVLNQTLENAGPFGESAGRRKSRGVSMVVMERVLVNVMRMNVRLLDSCGPYSDPLLDSLKWLVMLPDALKAKLAPRVGEGVGTILRLNGQSIVSRHGWEVMCGILDKYSVYPSSRRIIFATVQSLVKAKCVHSYNFDLLKALVVSYTREAPGVESTKEDAEWREKSNGNGNAKVNGAEEDENIPISAVEVLFQMSKLLFAETFDRSSTVDAESVARMLWKEVLIDMKNLCLDERPGLGPLAFRHLQDMLLSPDTQQDPSTWLEIFQHVLFPLVDASSHSTEIGRLSATTILTRTLLQNIGTLSKSAEFNLLWLRVIKLMGVNLKSERESMIYISTLEVLKNLVMVLHTEEVFQSSAINSQQTVWDLTWDAIESYNPQVRTEIQTLIDQLDNPGQATPAPAPAPAPAPTPVEVEGEAEADVEG